MAKILVSNCLLGCDCRYKGDGCKCDRILALATDHTLIGVCPEQMGGLSTPRNPAEIVGDKIIASDGTDVSKQYKKGAETALYLANINKVDFAILKAKSPSCGSGKIYDGTFNGVLIDGYGVTARLLMDNGYKVYSENDLDDLPI